MNRNNRANGHKTLMVLVGCPDRNNAEDIPMLVYDSHAEPSEAMRMLHDSQTLWAGKSYGFVIPSTDIGSFRAAMGQNYPIEPKAEVPDKAFAFNMPRDDARLYLDAMRTYRG